MSGDDIPMMWGFQMTIFMSQLCQGCGYNEDECMGEGGSQFQDFRCRAYKVILIPSRVLQCVCTLDQPGILYLITTKMCLVY